MTYNDIKKIKINKEVEKNINHEVNREFFLFLAV